MKNGIISGPGESRSRQTAALRRFGNGRVWSMRSREQEIGAWERKWNGYGDEYYLESSWFESRFQKKSR